VLDGEVGDAAARIELVGRGMVGSVLLQRMLEERDFELIDAFDLKATLLQHPATLA